MHCSVCHCQVWPKYWESRNKFYLDAESSLLQACLDAIDEPHLKWHQLDLWVAHLQPLHHMLHQRALCRQKDTNVRSKRDFVFFGQINLPEKMSCWGSEWTCECHVPYMESVSSLKWPVFSAWSTWFWVMRFTMLMTSFWNYIFIRG